MEESILARANVIRTRVSYSKQDVWKPHVILTIPNVNSHTLVNLQVSILWHTARLWMINWAVSRSFLIQAGLKHSVNTEKIRVQTNQHCQCKHLSSDSVEQAEMLGLRKIIVNLLWDPSFKADVPPNSAVLHPCLAWVTGKKKGRKREKKKALNWRTEALHCVLGKCSNMENLQLTESPER